MIVHLLWIDTNAAQSVADLKALSEEARGRQVMLVIHAQVYLERRRQMQVHCKSQGTSFQSGLFDNFLDRLGYEVLEMRVTRETASTWADLLFLRYPDHAAWEAAKKATLGGELRKGFQVAPGRMPMTTDWLMALEIEHDQKSYVITKDSKEEWQALRNARPSRVFTWKEAIDWLRTFPRAA